ncbi:probable serine/threonine-protein kinase WNK2 [Dendronephthya gigantea]|uniref:probable serine/threonine-protein kinase WNK2 n=1 Tax=Dendronephthya gigantea TaxID=151771 RepID=UPI00106C1ABD|nr:probable serine/threonine-protein kinase WNK2 [Dendronephthya gigantea]
MSISAMNKLDFQELLGEKEWIFEDIIGKGRYGSVVKAKEVLTSEQFAIKVVEYESNDQRKYRSRELSLLVMNTSKHKENVMQYYYAWKKKYIDNEFLVIKMELCYRSLDVYMKEMSREETQAGVPPCISIVKDANLYKFVFPQILNGLDGIHTMKPRWIHRDITLANILVQLPCPKLIREIQIKIGDFGLARELPVGAGVHLSDQAKLDAIRKDSAERTLYQAPELSGHSYCEKVDMYSAGIVLYLLTSCPENQSENQWPSDVEMKALRDGQRDRSDLCHDDEVLAELLFSSSSSLLHKNPKQRPSAREALCKLPLQRNKDGDFDEDGEISFQATINLLSEKFTVINKSLGRGSYARVVSAELRTDKKQYAVKIIRRKDVPEKYKKRELSILSEQVKSSTSHNNIVRYYHSWEETVNGRSIFFIQMELCDKDLRSILQEKPHIVDNELLHKHVFEQILRALIYIHDKDFVHRDIYPPNILVCTPCEKTIETWVVKLADFGLARMIDQPSQSSPDEREEKLSSSAGNRYYRAPEMWKGSYGKKVDIYSAGVVLYRLSCCLKDDKEIEDALLKLQGEKMVDRNILSVGGDRLYDLLNSLVEEKPEKRPDAKEAKQKFKEYLSNKNPNPSKRKEEKQEKRPTAKEAEQNPDPNPNPNPNPSLPPIDVLSLDNVSHTKGEPTQPVENQRDDNVSQDETDSQPDHIPATTTGRVQFEDDDFEDGLR